jgi:hypothetical protein
MFFFVTYSQKKASEYFPIPEKVENLLKNEIKMYKENGKLLE